MRDFGNFLSFLNFCRNHALAFDLHYSESEDSISIEVSGIGEGERWYGREIASFEEAIPEISGEFGFTLDTSTMLV